MDIQPAEFLNVQMRLASNSAGPPSHDSSSSSTSPNSVNMPTIMEPLQTTFSQYPDGNNFINPEFITATPITFQNGLKVHIPVPIPIPIPIPIPAPAPAPIPVLVPSSLASNPGRSLSEHKPISSPPWANNLTVSLIFFDTN